MILLQCNEVCLTYCVYPVSSVIDPQISFGVEVICSGGIM